MQFISLVVAQFVLKKDFPDIDRNTWRFLMEELLTASQVADLLQVHLRTVYKLVRQGNIPGRKFGGGWRFSKNEIMKMLAVEVSKDSTERSNSISKSR